MPDVSPSAFASFRENMYGGDRVLFNVDEAFLNQCQTPLLVFMGKDLYHPESSSRLVAAQAPDLADGDRDDLLQRATGIHDRLAVRLLRHDDREHAGDV